MVKYNKSDVKDIFKKLSNLKLCIFWSDDTFKPKKKQKAKTAGVFSGT